MQSEDIHRRNLLRLGGTAVAFGAAGAFLRPVAAGAATGALQFGQANDSGGASTGLTSSNGTDTLHVTNSANGAAIEARSATAAVLGTGSSVGGVVGTTEGTGPGVWGQSGTAAGPAVRADVAAATSAALAVSAHTKGLGAGVLASIENTGNKSAALRAQTSGPGPAVSASSALGAGGTFSGKTAQIQLVPSAASIHPPKGAAGQLFVDRSNRLWFCKGGTNWHQLA